MKQPVFSQEFVDEMYDTVVNYAAGNTVPPNENLCGELDSIAEKINLYEQTMDKELRKKTGSFYTDMDIVKFMMESILSDVDIVNNPYIRIFDPSCGCGNFLSVAYDILKAKLIDNIDQINIVHPEINLTLDNIHEHIITHNLFGADINQAGVKLSTVVLMLKKVGSGVKPNIVCCDSLVEWENTSFKNNEFWNCKFDIIVGNPPYIGHKKLSSQYKKLLNTIYGDIFRDKADISFCFIKFSIDKLCEGGRLCFITSRYFMESPNGKSLRNFIKQNCIIQKIVDFYGVRIMKGISVDPVIVYLKKGFPSKINNVNVLKARQSLKFLKAESIFKEISQRNSNFVKSFSTPQFDLDDQGWILISSEEASIIKKIEQKLTVRLSEVCISFQGIITGCDRAFVVDDTMIEKYDIERDIIRKWIKNSNIKKYHITDSNLYLICSDLINDPDDYPRAISYIKTYRERLKKRRECLRGVRKWYELQWGRDKKLFDSRKIVFPYKSSSNRFAIDTGSYNSADVYNMVINEKYKSSISYEFLTGLLNSKLYEFYFKSFAKKLGDNMYDYYPNTVMRLMVPEHDDFNITRCVIKIMGCGQHDNASCIIDDIDKYVYDMFNLSKEEIEIVERGIENI